MAAAQTVGGLAADKVDAVKTAAIASLPQQGVLYHGLEVMGGGSILAGLVLGAIGVFVIERDFLKASAFALAGAVMTYFGFMHGEAVGIGGGLGVTPGVALAYAVMAAGLFALAKTSDERRLQRAFGSADGGAGGVAGCRVPRTLRSASAVRCRAGVYAAAGSRLSEAAFHAASRPGTHAIPYAPTNASIVPLPSAGGTTTPSALLTPTAPSAFSAAATSATITSPAPPRSGRPASDTPG